MKCPECGTTMRLQKGYDIDSKVLGKVHLRNVEVEHCANCDISLLTLDSAQTANIELAALEESAINEIPVGNFITLNESAEILGVTKQAFQKNARIQRGFIFSVTKGRSKLYDKKSVKLFAASGDGRYRLNANSQHPFHMENFEHFEQYLIKWKYSAEKKTIKRQAEPKFIHFATDVSPAHEKIGEYQVSIPHYGRIRNITEFAR